MRSPVGPSSFSPTFFRSRLGPHTAQLLVAAYLVGILVTAIYMLLTAWRSTSRFDWMAQTLLLFVLPTVVYQLGFFHYIPELLGRKIPRTKAQASCRRWSRLFRASQWVFVPFVFLFWILMGSPSDIFTTGLLEVCLATAFWVGIAALICAALRRYLLWQTGQSLEACSDQRRHPFDWLARYLKPEITIPVGALLVLSSLVLSSSLSGWGSSRPGVKILTGSVPWITSEHLPDMYPAEKELLFWLGRSLYVLGISLAAVTAFLWLRGRVDLVRRLRPRLGGITILTVLIALFAVSDLFFGFLALDSELPRPAGHAIFFFRMAYWLVPVALWALHGRWAALEKRWSRLEGTFIVL